MQSPPMIIKMTFSEKNDIFSIVALVQKEFKKPSSQ